MDIQSVITKFLPSFSNISDLLIYFFIAVVTVTGVIKCLIPLWRATGAVRHATHLLEHDFDPDAKEMPIWQSSSFMGRQMRGTWLRFLQNAEQLDRRGLPCDIDNYINDETVTYGPGNASLAELIPNLLTSLGILGTFIGMMQGLTGLDMGNSDSLMSSIPQLLQGMRFAFGTSIAGIGCSLVFNMLYHMAQGSSFRATDDFTEIFTKRAMKRPLDHDVQIICQNQDRNHMLFNATDGLTVQVTQSIEGAMTRVMMPIAHTMDRFLEGTTRTQIDGVNRIVDNFVKTMNDTLSGQFLRMGDLMTRMNQNQELCVRSVTDSVEAAGSITAEVDRLQTVSNELIQRFAEYVQTIEAGRRHDEQYESCNTALLNQMKQLLQEQEKALQSVHALQTKLNQEMSTFSGSSQTYLDSLNRSAGAQVEASRSLSDGCTKFVTEVLGGVSSSLTDFETGTRSMLQLMTQRVEALTASGTPETAAKLSEMQKTLTSISEVLGKVPGKEA